MENSYFEATIRGCEENHDDLTGVDLSMHTFVDDQILRLANCLKKNSHVTSLDLFGAKIPWSTQNPSSWIALFNSLPPQLTNLDLGSLKLSSAPRSVVEAAFTNIGRLSNLSELSLSGNELDDSAPIDSLCASVAKLGDLHEFFIQNNKLTDASGEKISKSLEVILSKKDHKMSKIWMQANQFSDEGRARMRASLAKVLQNDSNRLEL